MQTNCICSGRSFVNGQTSKWGLPLRLVGVVLARPFGFRPVGLSKTHRREEYSSQNQQDPILANVSHRRPPVTLA